MLKRLSFIAVALLFMNGAVTMAGAQETAPSQATQQNERIFEASIPTHVPLKIKINRGKEKGFKDLTNESWASEFELAITNTGRKPIYEFYLLLVTDVRAAAGYRIATPLRYGRPELADLNVRPIKEDVPLKPGETVVLVINPGQLQAWEALKKKENHPLPKTVQIKLQGISFGDGTGYIGNEDVLIPSLQLLS